MLGPISNSWWLNNLLLGLKNPFWGHMSPILFYRLISVCVFTFFDERTKLINHILGSCKHKSVRGPNMGHFCLSCIRLVYFLRKSTEFQANQTECQRNLFHFLLLIFSYFLQSLCFRPLPLTSIVASKHPRRSQLLPQNSYCLHFS